jgi:hypothetical protein
MSAPSSGLKRIEERNLFQTGRPVDFQWITWQVKTPHIDEQNAKFPNVHPVLYRVN